MNTASELEANVQIAREKREREASKKRQWKQWALEAAAQRASKLAGKLSDPVLLVACLRFYSSLPPGEWVPSATIHERTQGKTRRVKNHCTAARRVLQVKQRDFHREIRLPLNWVERLSNVGITFVHHPDFLVLNEELKLDDDVCIFAREHPELLQQVKAFLHGARPQPDKSMKTGKTSKGTRYKSLHEALAQENGTEIEDEYAYDDESPEPEEKAWSRSQWLQERIRHFCVSS